MTSKKTQLNIMAFSFLAIAFMVVFAQHQVARETQDKRVDTELKLTKAQVRLEKCVDIAADARDEALMSEDAWMRALDDLSYCEFWEEYGDGIGHGQCLGPEYWTSYNPLVGP